VRKCESAKVRKYGSTEVRKYGRRYEARRKRSSCVRGAPPLPASPPKTPGGEVTRSTSTRARPGGTAIEFSLPPAVCGGRAGDGGRWRAQCDPRRDSIEFSPSPAAGEGAGGRGPRRAPVRSLSTSLNLSATPTSPRFFWGRSRGDERVGACPRAVSRPERDRIPPPRGASGGAPRTPAPSPFAAPQIHPPHHQPTFYTAEPRSSSQNI
jgi:hypothetical protein